MNIVDMAHQIIDLAEDRNYWKREALHYKAMHEEDMEDLNKRIKMQQETSVNILTAILDPNSNINCMVRAIERDPLKGEVVR